MRYLRYIFLLAALSLTSCLEKELQPTPSPASGDGRQVALRFNLALPGGAPGTKATIDSSPDIDNIYVAVFNNSGFFNEWVPATIESVTEENYDGTPATKYELTVKLTMSESRLRVHFIANCPEKFRSAPPITGDSSQDLEEIFMSKIRSQIGDTHNDGYWQKVLLPKGIRAQVTLDEDGVTEIYATDANGDYIPTDETIAQFPDPIVLVRNFARVYLSNLATNDSGVKDVTIAKFGLAYAPAEGPIAPILMHPYISDEAGNYVADPDNYPDRTYFESFFINYQNYPLVATETHPVSLSSPPYHYVGHTPANLAFGTYADPSDPDKDPNLPTLDEMIPWTADTPLFIYERELPKRTQPATRILIYAHKDGEKDSGGNDLYKYYALDIVNEDGDYIPLLRNNTYTVKLLKIESGSGETSIDAAAGASSATVYGDINKQHVTEISNGVSSIGTSYTEMMYVKPGTYELMFRYIATNEGDDANKERLDLVTLQIGDKNEETGAFTPVAASAASGSNAFLIEGGNYKVRIDSNDSGVIPYVRSGNSWVAATAAQIADSSVEKWGKILYTTIGTASDGLVDSEGYFTQPRTQTVRVTGTYDGKAIFRDVIIKLSPRRKMLVSCLDKYVLAATKEKEKVRIRIPDDLSRSIFPLQFKIEAAAHSLTPDGDVLPVTSGATIVPDASGPAYYFIRELTWERYKALPGENVGGVRWLYFDSRFKTTIPESACNVYVKNDYFESNADAYDNFNNYYQRLFTDLRFTKSGSDIRFTCTLDAAHTGTTVWWDPSVNPNCLSEDYRVLPYAFTVVLDGIDPKLDDVTGQPVDAEIKAVAGADNTYLVILGSRETSANADRRFVVLDFVLAEDNTNGKYGITLNTTNLTDNPSLYAQATKQAGNKVKRSGSYELTFSSSNYQQNTFSDSNVNISFINSSGETEGGGFLSASRYYHLMGYKNGNTYRNGQISINGIESDTVITGLRITYSTDGSWFNPTTYNSQNVTYNPSGSSPSKTQWNGSSNSVTVSMSCSNNNQYNNRNRVASITVNYDYWVEE